MDTWSGAPRPSWCTTRVCEGSAAEVAALLDGFAVGGVRVTIAGARLALDASGPVAGVTTVAAARVHGARLRYSRWLPPARVTVEVEPWSRDRCELLIRPARRLPPGADAYLRAAVHLVDALALELGIAGLTTPAGGRVADSPLRRAS